MKIAIVHSVGYPATEGIGFYVEGLAKQLVARGHHVVAVTRGGVRHAVHDHPDGYQVLAGAYLPLFPFHVHLHGLLLKRSIRALEDGVDLFHLHSPLVPVPHTRRPIVATVHTPKRFESRAAERADLASSLARAQTPVSVWLERQLLRRSDAITAVSEGVSRDLYSYGVPRSRVTVVGNGTDTSLFKPDGAEPGHPPRFLYAGRLAHRKGLFDLLSAFRIVAASHGEVSLRLAGAGHLAGDLRAWVRRHNLESRVVFLGHVSDRLQLRREYLRASVYVQPSHFEGLPTSLLEAMSCARPVIASAIPGHVELIADGYNGRLVPPKEPEALAHELTRLLRERDRANSMGRAARATICQGYGWPRIAEKFERIYESVRGTTKAAEQ